MNKYRKSFFVGLLIILGLFINLKVVVAHPLDITASQFFIFSDSSKIEATTFIHPFLIGLLFEKKDIASESPADFYENKDIIVDYLNENVKIKNEGKFCKMAAANLPPLDEFEMMGAGLEVDYEFECESVIKKLDYENTLFVEFSDLQTNKMEFYKDNEIQSYLRSGEEQTQIVLTAKVSTGFFDFKNFDNNAIEIIDADKDGLADAEEQLYKTDKNNSDSDFDGYSDKEEIDNGWNPISADISPGQTARAVEEIIEDQPIIVTSEDKETSHPEIDSSKYFKTGRLQKFLEKLQSLFEKDDVWSKILIFGLIYILGILHAFESGHGKGILISYLVEYDKGKKDAFVFSSVMTLTHLADVIILSVVFKLLSLSADIYNYINSIQKIGALILLIMGIYYLIKSFAPAGEFAEGSSLKKATWLGFIAGLAPCTIGWAIMVILLSIGKINWIIPIIIIFGLGIWTTLLLFSYIFIKVKDKMLVKIKGFAKASSIISAVLLIIIACILLF